MLAGVLIPGHPGRQVLPRPRRVEGGPSCGGLEPTPKLPLHPGMPQGPQKWVLTSGVDFALESVGAKSYSSANHDNGGLTVTLEVDLKECRVDSARDPLLPA